MSSRPTRGVRRKQRLLLLAVLFALPAPVSASDPSPGEVLERAFRNAYDLDRRAVVEIVTRNRHGEVLAQRAQLASKRIGGRLHTLAYFVEPEHVLGTRILTIENATRSYDSFVYLPSLGSVRRITSAQRGQSFLGTDLTYEEFERRSTADYEVEGMRAAELDGEPVYVVRARPRLPRSYQRVELFIAQQDFALLESRYYKRDARDPFRILRAPRDSMKRFAGHVVPTRVLVRSLDAGTETEVRVDRLAVNPELDDRLFTARSLEYGPPIPGLD